MYKSYYSPLNFNNNKYWLSLSPSSPELTLWKVEDFLIIFALLFLIFFVSGLLRTGSLTMFVGISSAELSLKTHVCLLPFYEYQLLVRLSKNVLKVLKTHILFFANVRYVSIINWIPAQCTLVININETFGTVNAFAAAVCTQHYFTWFYIHFTCLISTQEAY